MTQLKLRTCKVKDITAFHNQYGGLEDVKHIIFGCSTTAGQRVILKCEKLLPIKKLFFY
jgi:hypothetical protein